MMSDNTAVPAKSEPRWERRKDARPQELLEAALDLFVEKGFAATRLEDVAARAGVSKGTLYLYFDNKQELFKAVVREGVVPVIGQAERLVEEYTGHSKDLFHEFIQGWFRNIGNHKLAGISKLVMSESGNFPEIAAFYFEEVIQRNQALIESLLRRGIKRGEFREMDVTLMRTIVVAPVMLMMMTRHCQGTFNREVIDPKKYLESFIDFALNGMLTPAASVSASTPNKKTSKK